MFTDEQREAIRAAMLAEASAEPDPIPVVVTNHPEEAPEPDLTPALAAIAQAVQGVSGEAIATAVNAAAKEIKNANARNVTAAAQMIVDAIKAIPKAETGDAVDIAPITTAIDRNTAALERLAKVMATPKTLIFDEMDPTKPVGVKMQRAN
jgi:hypothetical protein